MLSLNKYFKTSKPSDSEDDAKARDQSDIEDPVQTPDESQFPPMRVVLPVALSLYLTVFLSALVSKGGAQQSLKNGLRISRIEQS